MPFALKTNSRSINLKPNKSHQLEIRSEFKVSKEDLLPKIWWNFFVFTSRMILINLILLIFEVKLIKLSTKQLYFIALK